MEMGERGQLPADAVEEGQVGEQRDQVNEHVGRRPPGNADNRGEYREQQQPAGGSHATKISYDEHILG